MTKTNNQEGYAKWMEGYDVVCGEDTEIEGVHSEFEEVLRNSGEKTFTEGEVFLGKIAKITDDFVTIDIGYKQDGLVFTREFQDYEGNMTIKIGDEIEVYLEKLESSLGNLVLSRDKAEILRAWDKISEACDQGDPIIGTIISKVKGGLVVDIGVKAFLPGSQMDIRPVRNLDKFINKRMEFKVIKFNKKRGNIVLSRRAILQEQRDKLRGETLGQIQEGMIVKGMIKNITDYGAFIDLGGVDGLLHITDMSWGRVKHPENLLKVGEEIDVKILRFDEGKERVSLGLKQIQSNPWESVRDIYHPGTVVEGEVVSIKEYGIFLELNDGIEGLIHISEASWSSRVKHPSKYARVGEKLKAQVLEVDVENEKISLSLRQLQPNPWDEIENKYQVGQRIKGTIRSIVDFGLFVDIQEEMDAFVHVSDFFWVKRNVNPHVEYSEEQEIEAVVLAIDKDNQKFSLGIKQLEGDPWEGIESQFPVGEIVDTTVVRITDFGAFVDLGTGIEGLIHISEMSEERINSISDVIQKGDQVQAMVISVDREAKKIALSIKAIAKKDDQEAMDRMRKEQQPKKEKAKSTTLGEKLKNIIISR